MGGWLGKYDPVYTGAQIRIDSYEKWIAQDRFLRGCSPDYYIPVDGAMTPDQKGSRYLYNSTYFHECRHALDYLISPFLSARQVCLFLSGFYGFGFIDVTHDHPGIFDIIPNPLFRWVKLPVEQKRKQLLEWGLDPESCSFPDVDINTRSLPPVNPDDMKTVAESLLAQACFNWEQYLKYDSWHPDTGEKVLSINSILESSALLTQLFQIKQYYNKEGGLYCHELIQQLFKFKSNVYSDALTLVFLHLTSRNLSGNPLMDSLYILHWALLGEEFSPDGSLDRSHPVARLYFLMRLGIIQAQDLEFIQTDPIRIFNLWQERLGLKKIEPRAGITIWNQVKPLVYTTDFSKSLFFKQYDTQILVREKLIEQYCHNPSLYINPAHFINNLYSFPDIPVRFIYPRNSRWVRDGDNRYLSFLKELESSPSPELTHIVDAPRFPSMPGSAYLHPEPEEIILSGENISFAEKSLPAVELLLNGTTGPDSEEYLRETLGGAKLYYVF